MEANTASPSVVSTLASVKFSPAFKRSRCRSMKRHSSTVSCGVKVIMSDLHQFDLALALGVPYTGSHDEAVIDHTVHHQIFKVLGADLEFEPAWIKDAPELVACAVPTYALLDAEAFHWHVVDDARLQVLLYHEVLHSRGARFPIVLLTCAPHFAILIAIRFTTVIAIRPLVLRFFVCSRRTSFPARKSGQRRAAL